MPLQVPVSREPRIENFGKKEWKFEMKDKLQLDQKSDETLTSG
jgi:hypothetical protein